MYHTFQNAVDMYREIRGIYHMEHEQEMIKNIEKFIVIQFDARAGEVVLMPAKLPVKMTAVVQHSGAQIASKALVNDGQKEIRFFSYAKGEDIDRET